MRSTASVTTLMGGVAAAALLCVQPATAQTALGAPADAETAVQETASTDVLVIGTRRTDRSATDSASPVDVIGSDELTSQPAPNMLDVVKNIVPSFFVPQNTISDASTFVRAPSLRGLSADQILVMINGKRYNRAALVNVATGSDTALSFGAQGADISNIPAIAIKNLQVLRDGATAQYGSDAIAGVINYQLRDDAGFELQSLYGQTYEGDGESLQISGNVGFKFGERGFVNLSAEYFDQNQTSRGETRPIARVLAQVQPAVAARIPNFPGPAQIWGTSPADGYKLFLNSAIDVGQESQFYLTANYAHSEANQSFNYRSPISAPTPLAVNDGTGAAATRSPGANGAFNPIYTTPCPTGNLTCPVGGFVRTGGATFNFTSIYPGGFTPRFLGEVDQAHGTLGFKGKTESGTTYDLSATFARNALALSMNGSLNSSFGPQSQTAFFFGKLIQKEQVINLDLTHPLEVGFASPITLSGGAEYRREEYTTTVGDLQSYAAGPFASQPLYDLVSPGVYRRATNTSGPITATQSPAASGYGGVSPTFAGSNSQTSFAGYVGAETDITEAFTVGVAGRYEEYNTFGSAVVGKLNGIYRITDTVSVRGTVGTGFHAPSPGQNNTQILTTAFSPTGEQVQTGTYPVTSDIAQFYGASLLKPEKSFNFGGGIVLSPAGSFTLTIDGYSIKVRDRIGISQTFTVSAADALALPSLASVGVGGDVQYFTNGFDTRTRGVDVVGNYRTTLAGGRLGLTLAYNYNKNKVVEFDPSVINADQRFDIGHVAPRHRANGSVNWQIGNFTLNARESFYGQWSARQDYPGQTFGSKFLTDLDVSYAFMDHFTLTVGANNLFDTFPTKIAATTVNPIYALTGSTADGQIYPRNGGPFGINGGFYYARLRVKY